MESESMNEARSLDVIRQMIAVSGKRFSNDGILFIVWGWLLFLNSFAGYAERSMDIPFWMKNIMNPSGILLFFAALAYTVYYLVKESKKVQTYIGVSLRYVWVSLVLSMVLVNLIQFNVLHSISFELQHPLFMVLMAFAVTVTGGILRSRLILFGGAFFGIMALGASWMELQHQLLVESVAWVVAFIVPGHILYRQRNN